MSPVGAVFHSMGLFIIGVLAAAWFGGAGPGVLAAFLSAISLPHLIAITYPLSVSHPLLVGFFDLASFVTLGLTGAAVGWGRTSYRRAGSALRERKRAEEALRASEERYALAVAGSDDGVWDCDFAARRVFVSARARELAGMPPGPEMVPLDEWFAALPLHPEDVPRRTATMQAHLAGKTPAYDGEFRLRQPDGVYRWRRLHGLCLRDANGNPHRMAGSISDVDARRRAEDALRLSEQRYAVALEVAEEGTWDWNVQTDEFFASPQTFRVYGLPEDRQYRTRSEGLADARFHPEDWPRVSAEWRAALAGQGVEHEFEYRILRDDEARWVRTRWKIFRDETGVALRVIGVVADITARKLAEEALQRGEAALRLSEERYALAMEASADGHFDTDLETDESFISARLAEIYGYPRKARTEDRAEWTKRIPLHPDDRHVLADLLRPDWKDPTRNSYEFQYRIVPRPGETRWIHTRGLVTRDAQGRPRRRIGVVADITARKLAEEALRLSEERYALALDVTEEGHFDWNVQTDQIFASAKALRVMNVPQDAGYRTRGDIMAHVRYHPDDWPRISEEWRAALAGRGLEHEFEYRILRGEETRSIRGRWKVFRDTDGVAQRVIGVVSDVTEIRKMEQELRRAQRLEAMGTLAGGIAHDFNNILGAILGYGEIALRDAPKGSRLARDLDSIVVAGERGRALVDRVLAFSRSAVGERVAVHVEKVVREALDLISAKLPPNVTLHAKLQSGPAAILGDATQVHQVLMNLATNAVHAMPAGGTLRVSLSAARLDAPRTPTVGIMPAGDYLILEVADSGTGIAPEILDRIFDPFFTTKEVGTGTGLGLSLVHGIVAALGGAIDVASTPGAGSTFTVFLPRSGDALDSSREVEPELPRGDGQRVLVVDDEEPLVQIATRTLEELGYAPVGFTSSVAALAAFRADPQRFDAVITDERMPGMSGLALIREVRGIRDRIPVVLMSGFVGGTMASAAREGGAEEVLKKPLLARDLAESLARVCAPQAGKQ